MQEMSHTNIQLRKQHHDKKTVRQVSAAKISFLKKVNVFFIYNFGVLSMILTHIGHTPI